MESVQISRGWIERIGSLRLRKLEKSRCPTSFNLFHRSKIENPLTGPNVPIARLKSRKTTSFARGVVVVLEIAAEPAAQCLGRGPRIAGIVDRESRRNCRRAPAAGVRCWHTTGPSARTAALC